MKQTKERLKKQFDFILEADKEKNIGRQTYIGDGSRKENDAEHAWHLALMTLLLGEYANTPIDVLKTVTMVILHDIVEIDAGDTYAYDNKGIETQRERETKAADRIFGILPKDQGQKFRKLWEEFEAGETPEARFAKTMDRIQPMMLNAATDGRAWQEHGVTRTQIMARNKETSCGSKALWDYTLETFVEPNVKKGRIGEE